MLIWMPLNTKMKRRNTFWEVFQDCFLPWFIEAFRWLEAILDQVLENIPSMINRTEAKKHPGHYNIISSKYSWGLVEAKWTFWTAGKLTLRKHEMPQQVLGSILLVKILLCRGNLVETLRSVLETVGDAIKIHPGSV